MIGLQTTHYGVVFGKILRVTTSRLVVEIDRPLKVGETVPWRMELLGRPETVLGELVVGRCEGKGNGEYVVRAIVTSMSERDRELFRDWLLQEKEGGTTRTFDSSVASSSDFRVGGQRKRFGGANSVSRSDVEAKREALRRIDARRRRAGGGPDLGKDAFGLGSELRSDVSTGRSGRKAVGKALQDALGRRDTASVSKGSREQEPRSRRALRAMDGNAELSSVEAERARRRQRWRERFDARSTVSQVSERPDSARARRRKESSSGAADRAGSARRAAADALRDASPRPVRRLEVAPLEARPVAREPRVALEPGDPPLLDVTWSSQEAFLTDYRKHLQGDGLFVHLTDIGPRRTRIRVRLSFPSGACMSTHAEVVVQMPAGTGLALELDRSQRGLIAVEAAGGGVSGGPRSAAGASGPAGGR